MVMAAVSLLGRAPDLDEAEVREGLEGNLCRCTGYHNIVKAVLAAAAEAIGMIPAAFDYVRAGSARRGHRAARGSTARTPSCSPAATRCCRS